MGEIHKVTMPKWGLSMTHGKVIEWLVAEGDEVAAGTELADIETEKIAGTLEAADAGVVRRFVADVGADVPVSATIALVAPADVPDSEIDAAAAAAAEEVAAGTLAVDEGPVVSTVEVAGRTLSYVTAGEEGETVVLVHGYGGDANSWLFVQEPLAAKHVVHAVDLPGHGASSKDVGDGSLATLAEVVLGFLDAAGTGRAHLVGHSLGGAVIAAAAAQAPERVASLTLVAPAGCGTEADAEYLRGFAGAQSRRDLKPLVGRLFADSGQVTRQLVDDLLKYKRLDGVDAALHRLVDTLLDGDRQRIDTVATLTQLSVPVTVVWGAADQILPAAHAENVRRARPDAKVTVVPDAGHMVHMEAPPSVREALT
ncbi:MAG: acetoin dehydrogenase dihydrolipoyllysine-residue acetyltransferase subunit [Streptosporangiales bacterium]|nr:acetoin dehydrogenase dihydrolipoyllysine-residue acetyltransferase subunit [Streptosporangiales bacterium]